MEKIKSKLDFIQQFELTEEDSRDLLILIEGYNSLIKRISVG
jgi:hypothetical protein